MELLDFKILNTAIERLLNQKLAEFGITYTQATVIGYLKRNQGKEIFQKDIEYHLGLNHSTVSILLRRMEDKQMVKIQCLDSDRRYKKVSITAQALEISEQISVKIPASARNFIRKAAANQPNHEANDPKHQIIRFGACLLRQAPKK